MASPSPIWFFVQGVNITDIKIKSLSFPIESEQASYRSYCMLLAGF
jgi:hypothetical protein